MWSCMPGHISMQIPDCYLNPPSKGFPHNRIRPNNILLQFSHYTQILGEKGVGSGLGDLAGCGFLIQLLEQAHCKKGPRNLTLIRA